MTVTSPAPAPTLASSTAPAPARARALARALARARSLTRPRAYDLDLAYDLNIARSLALALARARDRDLNVELALELVLELARAHDIVRDIDRSSNQSTVDNPSQVEQTWAGVLLWISILARANLSAGASLSNSDLDEVAQTWHAAVAAAPAALRMALSRLVLPGARAPAEQWQHLERDLCVVLQTHLDIGHEWDFNAAQLTVLGNYLAASIRLLECLDVAALPDRDAIRNRLLLPPATPDRRRPPKGRARQ